MTLTKQACFIINTANLGFDEKSVAIDSGIQIDMRISTYEGEKVLG
jgi:hypothetical protein